MFSGIVEGLSPILSTQSRTETNSEAVQIFVKCPTHFDDLKRGDSISVNGVCLTVEEFDAQQIRFTLGHETLQVTGWSAASLKGQQVNLERSMRLGDRIHGHLVSGHVDGRATVISVEKGESWIVQMRVPDLARRLVWPKGSITFNGVSLTVNQIEGNVISVCLIPETLQRTNLQFLNPGDGINVEYDLWAKAFANYQEQRLRDRDGAAKEVLS